MPLDREALPVLMNSLVRSAFLGASGFATVSAVTRSMHRMNGR